MLDLVDWEARFERQIAAACIAADPAHDLAHFQRVVAAAKTIARSEGGRLEVVVPAAWLHDFVLVPKDSPDRPRASRIAAAAAREWLSAEGYPGEWLDAIEHAIAAHSFTARIEPVTIEAKVVQDADRLDAIGAVGIARCLMLGGVMGRPLYDATEPIPKQRTPDDARSTIDHFYTKLFSLAATMQTATGRAEAERRTTFMRAYIEQLEREILACVELQG